MSLVFGKYEKIRRIAQGGMGEVFLARQTGVLDRLAILKSLRTDLASEREFVEQFLDEARVAATLNHPNIVSIYDVGEWNGTYYIAMEYVPGEDLSKLWYAAAKAGVGLPFQVSVRICYEAALGLDHAHKAKDVRGNPLNIVHRDVSPQNIMVRGDGVVKLVDFGIAKAANKSSRTQTGMVKGKLQYMSPEQVRGEGLDGRSDQFSLGVVLWEMCTGRRLFKADTEINTLQKILQSPIPKPADHVPGFPPELETTILKMLQRDVEKRFKATGDVANELKTYLDRAALASGETTVAGFVQQILGRELEERVRDLTPMESTEHGVLNPLDQKRPITASKQRASTQSGMRAAVNDGPTQIVGGPEDDIQKIPSGPAGEWAVRKTDGKVMYFAEMSTLHQWILDGQVVGDDSFSNDGKSWKKLNAAPQFQKFLEIATAAQQVARGPSTAPQSSGKTITRPLTSAQQAAADPPTISLNLPPEDKAAAANDAFSLGDLPVSKTGTWGAPEIAMAVANAKAAQGGALAAQGPSAGTPSPELGLTPTTRESVQNTARVPRPQQAARVPTIVWMLGGIVVALALVIGGLAAVEPDLLRNLVSTPSTGTEVLKALAASKADDPLAIDALLKTAEPAESADSAAAAAILHAARARVDDEVERLGAMLVELKDPPKTAPPNPEENRAAAYRLATKAQSLAGSGPAPGPLLALASFHAEKAAVPELSSDSDGATAAAKGTPLEAAVAAELPVLKALVDARAVLALTDAAAVRGAADKLAAIDDPRARSLLPLLYARAAMVSSDDAKADVAKLVEAARAIGDTASADPRAALVDSLARALKKKSGGKATPAAAVDAGPAVATSAVVDAGTKPAATVAAVVDAGVAAPPPPPPPPETYDSVLKGAKRAQGNGNPKEAERLGKHALELKPGGVEATIIVGFAQIDEEKYGPALATFRALQAANPKSCDAQIGIATSLERQGKTEDARKEYLGYLDICPTGRDADAAKGAAARLE